MSCRNVYNYVQIETYSLNLCICRILDLLIPLTNRVCDTGPNKVSPVYSAVFGGRGCLEMLLSLATAQYPDVPCFWIQFSLVYGFPKEYVYLLYFHSFGCMEMCFQMAFFCDKIACLRAKLGT